MGKIGLSTEVMMNSPIENRIGCLLIPVSDMPRAIAWYSRLFGLPSQSATHEGRIYTLPMQGEVGLILDSHKPVTNSSQPLCFFWTQDIKHAYAFLMESGVDVLAPPEDIGSVTTLLFQDPDHNLLMVCQRNL